MSNLNSDVLSAVGFADIAEWKLDGERISYCFDSADADLGRTMCDVPNALYAFVRGNDVQYIGKTTRSIRRRFVGYCRPGIRQRTNLRCNANIKAALARGETIRIFVFTPVSQLRYVDFEINLAAGLEDSLINAFDPPWNGRQLGRPVTEEAEREEAEAVVPCDALPDSGIAGQDYQPEQVLASFSIVLGNTYYNKGFINLGVAASQYMGGHGEPIEIILGDGSVPIFSMINRTANRSGGVRVVGRNREIAEWIQSHFHEGDTMNGKVLGSHRILLLPLR